MKAAYFVVMMAMFLACTDGDEKPENSGISLSYDFSADTEGWTADFADYPAGEEEMYELEFEYATLPGPLDTSEGALKLSSFNYSDDVFMFVKKQISGLTPNQEYLLNMEVEFASNESEGQFGIGGSPGESVYLKAGGSSTEPEKHQDEEGWYRLDIDKANQGNSGENMVIIGNFSNGTEENIYTLKTLSTLDPVQVTSNSEGSLWLLFGTDSGFEGKTTIYINSIDVNLIPAP